MRLSTIALALIAIGVASVSSAEVQPQSEPALISRDFARKMEVRSPRKHKHHNDRDENGSFLMKDAKFTWYGGGQLSNPACGGPSPNKHDLVVAVPTNSPAKCWDKLHLHYGGKMVEATVIDNCAGCADNQFDLTQGTFEALAALTVGELTGAHVRVFPHD